MSVCYTKAITPSAKIAIIGAGFVGSTIAYTMMLEGVASEIVLIDIDKEKATGEAYDLRHCMQFTRSVSVEAGDSFDLVKGASIVVVCAGFAQKVGEPRVNLLSENVKIFKSVIPKIVKCNSDCILLIVTNPLDVLTYVTLKLSGMPSCRVFGTGTVLDTSRLRYLIGQHLKVSPKDITAYVLGEHGDSEFVWWSKANIAGIPLNNFPTFTTEIMDKIYTRTRDSVYEVIKRKGATYYAVSAAVSKLVRAIIQGQSRVFTLSTLIEEEVYGIKDVCISVPTIIGANGVCQRLSIELDAKEKGLFIDSAIKIKESIRSISSLI
ncbi:MAG: L-lactate dehydrogenase [candidate division TM6 bacterium GW2011_GWF2_37_49]|nr:MAG: L-lactate dehydrogenase [candidate division TM6 bacterium GW2011_GWF2_37_49]